MYSRSYYADEAGRMPLPENYDGTTFMERQSDEADEVVFTEPPVEKTVEASARNDGIFSGLSKVPFLSNLFGSGSGFSGLKMPTIGVEEILILATAAFLFFSKDGDKESALILLLLLLIN